MECEDKYCAKSVESLTDLVLKVLAIMIGCYRLNQARSKSILLQEKKGK